jgi:hypothetical protein
MCKRICIYETINDLQNTFSKSLLNIKGTVHKWVDQFAIEPKSLFTQNHGQNLEITTNLN